MNRTKLFLYILCLFLFVFIGMIGGLLNIAWTYMHDEFGVGVGTLGILLAFGTTGTLIGTFGSGSLIGRFGIGKVALGAVIAAAIGLAGIASSTIWGILLIIFLMTYIGRGVIDASINNFASENYGAAEMNWLHASWGAGLMIAPTLMTVIIITLELSWRVGYLVLSGAAVVFAIIIMVTLKQWNDLSGTTSDATQDDLPRTSVREALQRPEIILGMLAFLIYGGVEVGTGQLANTLFVDGRGMAQETSSLLITVYWASFTVGRIIIGVIALRIGNEFLLRAGIVLTLIGCALLIPNISDLSNLIALIMIGTGLSGFIPILLIQTPARVGKRYTAQAIGMMIGFGGTGSALLPGILGFIGANLGIEFIAYGLFINAILLAGIYFALSQYDGRSKAKIA